MQETKVNSKESLNLKKIDGIIKVLNTLPDKVPGDMRLQDCDYKGSEILNKGTLNIKTHFSDGAVVTTEELKPFIEYLEQCKTNGELENIVIALYTHSNNRKLNNGIGLCKYQDADFANITVITSEKTIKINVNSIHPIKRKVGHRIEVFNTSWKRLPNIYSSPDRKEILMKRMISTMASIVEKHERKVITSKEEFIKLINSVDAVTLDELANKIKEDGVLNNLGTLKVLDVTNDKRILGIFKTIYNCFKDDKLRVNGSGAYNDTTSLSFEYENDTLEVEMSLNQIQVNITV